VSIDDPTTITTKLLSAFSPDSGSVEQFTSEVVIGGHSLPPSVIEQAASAIAYNMAEKDFVFQTGRLFVSEFVERQVCK